MFFLTGTKQQSSGTCKLVRFEMCPRRAKFQMADIHITRCNQSRAKSLVVLVDPPVTGRRHGPCKSVTKTADDTSRKPLAHKDRNFWLSRRGFSPHLVQMSGSHQQCETFLGKEQDSRPADVDTEYAKGRRSRTLDGPDSKGQWGEFHAAAGRSVLNSQHAKNV